MLKSAVRAISNLPVPMICPPDQFIAFVTVSTPLPARVPCVWFNVFTEVAGLSNWMRPPCISTLGNVKVPLMMAVPPSPSNVPAPVMAEGGPEGGGEQVHNGIVRGGGHIKGAVAEAFGKEKGPGLST